MKYDELMWEINRVLATVKPKPPRELPKETPDVTNSPVISPLDAATGLSGDDDRVLLAQPVCQRKGCTWRH